MSMGGQFQQREVGRWRMVDRARWTGGEWVSMDFVSLLVPVMKQRALSTPCLHVRWPRYRQKDASLDSCCRHLGFSDERAGSSRGPLHRISTDSRTRDDKHADQRQVCEQRPKQLLFHGGSEQ